MFSLVLFFPLAFSLVIGFGGRFVGINGSRLLATLGLFINLLSTVVFSVVIATQQLHYYAQVSNWISIYSVVVG